MLVFLFRLQVLPMLMYFLLCVNVHRIRKRCQQCLKTGKKETKTQFCCEQCDDVPLCMQGDVQNSCWTLWHKSVYQGMAKTNKKKQIFCVEEQFSEWQLIYFEIIGNKMIWYYVRISFICSKLQWQYVCCSLLLRTAYWHSFRREYTGMQMHSGCVFYFILSIGDLGS